MFGRAKREDEARRTAAAAAAAAAHKPETLIDTDTVFQGNIRDAGQLVINGSLEGNAHVKHLDLKKTGRIKGNVKAEVLIVEGEIDGEVHATRVVLASTARIRGPVTYSRISLTEGAAIMGEMIWLNAELHDKSNVAGQAPIGDPSPLRVLDGTRGRSV